MTDKEKAAAAKREYMRAWQRANPDKVKAAQERYWLKKYTAKQEQKGKAN